MHPHRSYLEYIHRLSFRILLTGMIALLAGCADKPSGNMEELNRINRMVDASADSADVALKSLDGMDEGKFSEEERFFHSFITMKARDKSMTPITSDTSYLALQEYYSKHPRNEIYPEVIYYGGRTYSDLGDYPRALKYYNEAYDLIKDDDSKLRQRGKILAQKGWLLDRLTLYEDAASCLEEAVSVDTALGDSVSLMYDSEFLGVVNFHAGRYEQAEKQLLGSLDLAEKYDRSQAGSVKVNLAGLYANMKEFKKAEGILQEISGHVEPKDLFLAYAAWIYSSLGKRDSAILYASRLLADTSCTTRISGFDILLSPEYAASLPSDTLLEYISEYRRLVKKDYNGYSMQNALLQNTLYNYSVHDREREEAEKYSMHLKDILFTLICISLLILLGAFYVKAKKQAKILELQRQLEKLRRLDETLNAPQSNSNKESDVEQKKRISSPALSQNIDTLREEVKKRLDRISNNKEEYKIVDRDVNNTSAFEDLQTRIKNKAVIPEKDPLWESLHELISSAYPDFFPQLANIYDGDMPPMTTKIVILIKCGVTPTQMVFLLGREKGTLSYWRRKLACRLMGDNAQTKTLDRIIYVLG